jgi:hypothetical protein
MRGSWRRHHETTAVIRTTLERGPTPSSAFLDGEPAGITLAVDRRPRDERPRAGPWRLQRRSVYLAGASLDAGPRRGESRRGHPVGIVDAVGVADYRAEAHSNAAPRANAHSLIDPKADASTDAHPHVATDAHPDLASDAEPNGDSDPHANGHPDPHTDAQPDADPHTDADTNTHAEANTHTDTDTHADTNANPDPDPDPNPDANPDANPGPGGGHRNRRGQPDWSTDFRCDRHIGRSHHDDEWKRRVYLPDG